MTTVTDSRAICPPTLPLSPKTQAFLERLAKVAPVFYPIVAATAAANSQLFYPVAERMIGWAEVLLGEATLDTLIDGYLAFTIHVNQSQVAYETRGHYENSSYEEVRRHTYDNAEFMKDYHWGVYVTTFAWPHHLQIMQLFQSMFLSYLTVSSPAPQLLELGSGSGVWSLTALQSAPHLRATLVDISQTSVDLSKRLIARTSHTAQMNVHHDNALTFQPKELADAGISCFLMEHLENPEQLLHSLHRNLRDRAYAFVTTALTAAEVDHIFEFRRESEVIQMAEASGFRVISSLSLAPKNTLSEKARFLPRSMALILQKRCQQLW